MSIEINIVDRDRATQLQKLESTQWQLKRVYAQNKAV
jgi:hypothetical protein